MLICDKDSLVILSQTQSVNKNDLSYTKFKVNMVLKTYLYQHQRKFTVFCFESGHFLGICNFQLREFVYSVDECTSALFIVVFYFCRLQFPFVSR